MMERYHIVSYSADRNVLAIKWGDGHKSTYHYIYLRDNCPSPKSIHENGQKITETAQLNPEIRPAHIELVKEDTIQITWEQDGHSSSFPAAWLRDHCLSTAEIEKRGQKDLLFEPIELWDSTLGIGVPQGEYQQVTEDRTSLTVWLEYVRRYGFAVLNDVPLRKAAVVEVARLFGYVRETNYGRVYQEKILLHPNNLTFTSQALSPRTDNPYRDPVPTLQLLHCLHNEVTGGDTIVVDGFKVATAMRKKHPDLFELLSRVPVSFRFRDKDHWIERKTTIIGLDPQKKLHSIRFNNRAIQPFEMDNQLIPDFYRAYQTFARMLDDPAAQVRFKMMPGQLFIADNERVLHGRTAFDRKEGKRHLQGTYADRDGLLSKLRMLKKN
ncbi:gamma-butyrobetaine dioxygenase [Pedobacter steynii]|uniref:Gamma-butyrobetaine dioxygenase n=1 Tax=Pedobacter steynii TaxID=430522 RepID=A0A1G9NLH7_9SPHI|nr:TauD/TfdA family dioxygenase [Pedobacter steynii]NQX39256.1 TauD/TfdA family dioxygenase [Pedobacter steynii]SDL87456.1 gamma-butyrobetaine dioxygenase [Pedobacter steynii]